MLKFFKERAKNKKFGRSNYAHGGNRERLLGELTGVEAHPPALMVDNQPAIALAKNPVLHDRSKHIDVKFHFLRDCVDEGRSSSSSSKLVGNSRTSSPSRSAVFDSRS